MKYLFLIRKNLTRKKLRLLFTLASIVVAFGLFCLLAAIRLGFSLGVDVTGDDRLIISHKTSLIQPLPLSYHRRLESLDGVAGATHQTWFGGKYQDEYEGRFGIFPVVPEEYLEMYPEFLLPEEQKKAWFANRTGIVVGRRIADDFGWQIGDRVPIQGTIFRKADGGDTWEFTIDGIYDPAETGVDATQFLLHYEYFNEARDFGQDLVGWYLVRIDDPEQAVAIGDRIDSMFANSFYETKTAPEKVFMQGFAQQIGNIGTILRWILGAVFLTILLVAGNTMVQSVRERTGELAVLKTLGYSNARVVSLVLAESMTLAVAGGGVGLAMGWVLVEALDPILGRYLPFFEVPPRDLLFGGLYAIMLGMIAGLLPAVFAMRLKIVDALRKS